MRELIPECAAQGYRTHILFADQVARTYWWNNQALSGSMRRLRMRWIRVGFWRRGGMGFGREGIGKGWDIYEEEGGAWEGWAEVVMCVQTS